MKKLSNKLSLYSIFVVAYFLIIFSDMYNDVKMLSSVLQIFDIISIGLLISIFIIQVKNKKTYDLKKLFILLLFFIVVLITSFVSRNRALIKLPLLLLAIHNFKFETIIKDDLKIRTFLLILITSLSLIGVIDLTLLEYRNGFPRYSFGMGHPNSYAFELVIIFCDLLYVLSKKKNSFKNNGIAFIVGLLFSLMMLFFIGSRTNIVLIWLLFILFKSYNKKFINKKIIKVIIENLFMIFLISSLVLAFLYSKVENIQVIDKFFSNRIFLMNFYLDNYNLNIFGNNIVTSSSYALDNAYVNLILRYGIILTIYMAYFYNKTIKKLFSNNESFLGYIIVLFLIYGLIETPMYIPGKCPYILLFSICLINKKGDEVNE